MGFSTVQEAIDSIGRLGMAVVVDDEDRENEGDLVMAAEAATPENIAFFLSYTSGVICVPLLPERADMLDLPLMVTANTEAQRTAFTVSVDYRHGTTTGISARDRASTIAALIDPHTRPHDLNRPGHIFPLRYRSGGVLKRAGHTEATVDLARAAGLSPAGVLCEIVTEDKSGMARLVDLERFAKKHDLPLISIADLIRYRRQNEKLVRLVSEARIPADGREFPPSSTQSRREQHLAHGWASGQPRTCSCACTPMPERSVSAHSAATAAPSCRRRTTSSSRGPLRARLPPRPRGPRSVSATRSGAYQLQEDPTPWTPTCSRAPGRQPGYSIGAQMLVDLGVTTMRLMTNNPVEYSRAERASGFPITERVPLQLAGEPREHRLPAHQAGTYGPPLHGLDDVLYEAPAAKGVTPGSRRPFSTVPPPPDGRIRPDRAAGRAPSMTLRPASAPACTARRTAPGSASASPARSSTAASRCGCSTEPSTRLAGAGTDRRDVTVAWAPGAFELPLVARAFAHAGKVEAVLCLGAVIRGDTGHYDFVAGECASGIQRVQLDTGLPVVFGVLTTDTLEQALERSRPDETNKGREAALTGVEMVRLLRSGPLS